jgi:S-DNA-T family DNA segregation ATPase FtsK/SpoIIIE
MDNKEKLSNILKTFGIKGEIMDVVEGGRITRYELRIDEKQKVKPIQNLAVEIGTAFGVGNTVIVQPIYSKEYTVGIEIPNVEKEDVAAPKTPTTFPIGETVDGKTVYADVCAFPHLLVAGTTGSGKSVCLNSIITSLIGSSSPDEVALILIDPKQVELSAYRDAPHLICPILTEPKKATKALEWLAKKMDERYGVLEKAAMKDADAYNKANLGNPMAKIIVVIDELADLMMMSESRLNGNLRTRNGFETLLCRIAQKGRAAGIHLIVATQRPDKDVVTGRIKANFPSRIAFAVSSAINSRIILDEAGAEKLLGKGDMLYKPIGAMAAERLQGEYVSDSGISRAVEKSLAAHGKAKWCKSLCEAVADEKPSAKKDLGKLAYMFFSQENVAARRKLNA